MVSVGNQFSIPIPTHHSLGKNYTYMQTEVLINIKLANHEAGKPVQYQSDICIHPSWVLLRFYFFNLWLRLPEVLLSQLGFHSAETDSLTAKHLYLISVHQKIMFILSNDLSLLKLFSQFCKRILFVVTRCLLLAAFLLCQMTRLKQHHGFQIASY